MAWNYDYSGSLSEDLSLGGGAPNNLLDSDDEEPFVLELCDNRNFSNLEGTGGQRKPEVKHSATKNLDQRMSLEFKGGKQETQRKFSTRGSIKNPFSDNKWHTEREVPLPNSGNGLVHKFVTKPSNPTSPQLELDDIGWHKNNRKGKHEAIS